MTVQSARHSFNTRGASAPVLAYYPSIPWQQLPPLSVNSATMDATMNATAFTTTSVTSAESIIAAVKPFNIRIPNPAEVAEYINNNVQLLDVVTHAAQLSRQYYPAAQLSLEVRYSYEDGTPGLRLQIRQPTYTNNFFDNISKIDDLLIPEEEGLDPEIDFIVTSDFKAPRE
jgi:hypothetical protein